MSEKHLNNTEKAIAYIAKHPGCRSPEISEAIGVPTCNVSAILSNPVQAGYVVACKVECPGKPAMNEYRISATVAEDKVSWTEFRVAKRANLPLTKATPKPMRTAPPAPIPSKATQPLDAAPPPQGRNSAGHDTSAQGCPALAGTDTRATNPVRQGRTCCAGHPLPVRQQRPTAHRNAGRRTVLCHPPGNASPRQPHESHRACLEQKP